ncbi:hypothetical protein A1351_08600 [Methylosinus sp. R-45379]|uniref:hypothetical protein n=1 Tax=Methylosinus sp. R-45379 TaxID=980563 RepID=UPI0007C966BA|nr:hypothetical protein [Methylosinus sp. R-45379]OAI30551.1 hypothetical protein A1351_08600 [Methylosinus sp. R-45379]
MNALTTAQAVDATIDPFTDSRACAATEELAEFRDLLDGHLSRLRGEGWLGYFEKEYSEVAEHVSGISAILKDTFKKGVNITIDEEDGDFLPLTGSLHLLIDIGDDVEDIDLTISERAISLTRQPAYSYPRIAKDHAQRTDRRVFLAALSVCVLEHVAETGVQA